MKKQMSEEPYTKSIKTIQRRLILILLRALLAVVGSHHRCTDWNDFI